MNIHNALLHIIEMGIMMVSNKLYEKETHNTIYFAGGVFSNFYKTKVFFDGLEFKNSESAYMYAKATFFDDYEQALAIFNSKSAYDAKTLGRKVKGFNEKDWYDVSYDIMYNINVSKYRNSSYLADVLLDTNEKLIVEGREDNIWGVGISLYDNRILNQSLWTGENRLGKILMQIREDLKKDL